MPSVELMEAFDRARQAHRAATQLLVPILARMALETVRDALPGAARLEAVGELNEDRLQVLRIQRGLDDGGVVLFDVAVGHDDRAGFIGEHVTDAETVRDLVA